MDLGLRNKVAVVTGGSRGLGYFSARALAGEGARLAICARGSVGLDTAAESLRGLGAEVLAVQCDIAAEDGAEKLLGAVMERYGGIDVLVNNVGGNRRGTFEETTDRDWLDIIELNVLAGFRASRGAIPTMRERGGGAIVFISSVFGREKGGPGLSIYNTTKSALISAAGIMALELAKDRIRVNCVAPGSIRFEGGSLGQAREGRPGRHARLRAGQPPARPLRAGGGGGGRGGVPRVGTGQPDHGRVRGGGRGAGEVAGVTARGLLRGSRNPPGQARGSVPGGSGVRNSGDSGPKGLAVRQGRVVTAGTLGDSAASWPRRQSAAGATESTARMRVRGFQAGEDGIRRSEPTTISNPASSRIAFIRAMDL